MPRSLPPVDQILDHRPLPVGGDREDHRPLAARRELRRHGRGTRRSHARRPRHRPRGRASAACRAGGPRGDAIEPGAPVAREGRLAEDLLGESEGSRGWRGDRPTSSAASSTRRSPPSAAAPTTADGASAVIRRRIRSAVASRSVVIDCARRPAKARITPAESRRSARPRPAPQPVVRPAAGRPCASWSRAAGHPSPRCRTGGSRRATRATARRCNACR